MVLRPSVLVIVVQPATVAITVSLFKSSESESANTLLPLDVALIGTDTTPTPAGTPAPSIITVKKSVIFESAPNPCGGDCSGQSVDYRFQAGTSVAQGQVNCP